MAATATCSVTGVAGPALGARDSRVAAPAGCSTSTCVTARGPPTAAAHFSDAEAPSSGLRNPKEAIKYCNQIH